jgi:hypothetical protein
MVPLGQWEAHTNHLQQQQQQQQQQEHTIAVVIKTIEGITLTQGPCSVHKITVVTKCLVPYSKPITPSPGHFIKQGELVPLIMATIPKIDIVGHLVHIVNYKPISTSCHRRGSIQEKW